MSWTAIRFLRKKLLQSVTKILNVKLLYLPLVKRKLKKKISQAKCNQNMKKNWRNDKDR